MPSFLILSNTLELVEDVWMKARETIWTTTSPTCCMTWIPCILLPRRIALPSIIRWKSETEMESTNRKRVPDTIQKGSTVPDKLLFCHSHPYRTGVMMKKSWRMKKGWTWITKRRLPLGHHGVHKSLYCQGSRRDNTIRQSIKHLHRLLQGYSGVSTPKSKFGSIFIASSKQSANLHWLLAMN